MTVYIIQLMSCSELLLLFSAENTKHIWERKSIIIRTVREPGKSYWKDDAILSRSQP